MKNCEPPVSGALVLAIASVPGPYASLPVSSSGMVYPGPPVPVPDGSPHCNTKMVLGETVSRWHGVLSKKPCSASDTKELTVQGAVSASKVAFSVPMDVFIVTGTFPWTSGVGGGGFTLRVALWASGG